MQDVPYHVKRLGWLRSSKITRFSGAVVGLCELSPVYRSQLDP
jgi:hypothetical protein